MRTTSTLLLLLALGLAPGARAAAIATQTLNYQGQLTDLADLGVNGTASMGFEIYDAAVGGTQLWSQSSSTVSVSKGLFNVQLPINGAIPPASLNGQLFLQLTVNGTVMTPRQPILASMFALNADRLQGLLPNNAPGQIPVIDQATGRLLPSLLSAPFPLVVSGTAGPAQMAAGVVNQDPGANEIGLYAAGAAAGVSGVSNAVGGAGVIGTTAPSDNAAASGIWGVAVNGAAVRATASGLNAAAVLALNTNGASTNSLGIYGNAYYGGQFSGTHAGLRIGGPGLAGQPLVNTPLGIEVISSQSGITVANSGNGPGVFSNATGVGFAVEGQAQSAGGTAIRGEHMASVGTGRGVWGSSQSPGGIGVQADSTAASGAGYGLKASVASPGGAAIYASAPVAGIQAFATAGTGASFGLDAAAAADVGVGVHGTATGSGAAYGVLGDAGSAAAGAGVRGNGIAVGVQGVSAGTANGNAGVLGQGPVTGVLAQSSTLSSGVGAVGLKATAQAPDGTGVWGEAQGGPGTGVGVVANATGSGGIGAKGTGGLYGIWGTTLGANSAGVYGDGGQVGQGNGRSGVYGQVAAAPGEVVSGVQGLAVGANNTAYGVWGENDDPSGRGMRAFNTAAVGGPSGYALGVSGKLKLTEDNLHIFSNIGATQKVWNVTSQYCNAGDYVFVTPEMDITANGTVANTLWVDPNEVSDGHFILHAAQPVTDLRVHFLVITH